MLRIDVATKAVLSHEAPVSGKKLTSFEDAAREIQRRKDHASDLFAATVEREKHKGEILEKTFQQALERAQKDPGKPRGIFDDE